MCCETHSQKECRIVIDHYFGLKKWRNFAYDDSKEVMIKWSETAVTQRLNIRYPIIQGPFGGGSTATLVATVSNAGGLGSFGACDLSPELGAQGVQVGTAFLACEESGANPMHRKLLFEEDAKYTMLSRAYTGRLARSLSNRFGEDLQVHEPELAKYPAQNWIVAPLKAAAIAQGRSDLVSLDQFL
jgi:NAD(P)H-dependent flavin oxidoreductase YrpB (nitropropane dioxygenase family)